MNKPQRTFAAIVIGAWAGRWYEAGHGPFTLGEPASGETLHSSDIGLSVQQIAAKKSKAEIDAAVEAGDLFEVRVVRRKPCPTCGGQREYDAKDDSCLECGRNMETVEE